MGTVRAAARLVAVILCVGAVGACTDPGPGPGDPLVEYSASGGLCPVDLCGTEVTVARSGAWHATSGSRETDGKLSAADIADLTARIQRDIATLADLPPAPALCPSAYDGSDITYTFHAGASPVTVTNCDQKDPSRNREIPGSNPLLVHVARLVDSLINGTPAPSKLLVEYTASGGHCREICPTHRVTIGSDGRWTATNGPTSVNGQLTTAATSELARRIEAQWATLSRLPASSGCPSAYDGRDLVVTFQVGGRPIQVSNCTRDFGGNALLDYTIALVTSLLP